jgi:hypothetical protein
MSRRQARKDRVTISLAKEDYAMNLDLLTNATIVADTIRLFFEKQCSSIQIASSNYYFVVIV